MSNRVINVDVSDSYISMTGDTAGASGAMKATTMRMTFDDHWAGTSKTIYFTDALGEASVSVLLSADALVDGTAATYDVPIPAEAMTAEGLASVTVCGIALAADNVTVIRKITTKAAKFRVMDSEIPSSASNEAAVTATDKQQMQSALDKVTNMSVEASALAPGSAATVAKGADAAGNVKLSFGIPKGDTGATGPQGLKGDTGEKGDTGATGPQGPKGETGATGSPGRDGTNGIDGEDGRGIVSIVRTSGNGAAGTTDTYTVTYTDTTTSTFKVYNGADGTGAGDMLASVYDPAGKNAQMAVMSDIPTTLPASDVPAWAKAATKPSYTPAEVGAAPSVHTHTAEQVGADPSGSAAAVQANLDAHAARTDNPHGITCAKIGAQEAATAINSGNIGGQSVNWAQGAANANNANAVGGYSAAQLLAAAAAAGGKVTTGSYTGTGTFGPSNPSTLTFPFVPKIVLIYNIDQYLVSAFVKRLVWLAGSPSVQSASGQTQNGSSSNDTVTFNQTGNSLSWYGSSQWGYEGKSQCNELNSHYGWIAIG